ncbi:uncharacterized protein LOC116351204, partial [Contarinia nasturtii]|uniref:uncharacterized protein LOC116351204 n=1 Tax=Contarinia nasturtii TaxID=265458 RepID=UPI0012D3AF15
MDRPQKKLKLLHPVGDGNEDADAGPSNEESTPKIFKLNTDCFDETFEYLSLKDLHSFGQTCKRMNKVAGEYFKRNYSSIQTWCEIGGIYTNYSDKDGYNPKRIKISGFSEFTPNISIDDDDLSYIQPHVSEFNSVKRITFDYSIIDNETIKFFEQLLGQLEMVLLLKCAIDAGLYHLMLQHCGKLKKIFVRECKFNGHPIDEYEWLLHTYPKLEHLHLSAYEGIGKIEELSTFFERNPNVHRFSTDFDLIWDNRDVFSNSKIKLDILELGGSRSLLRTNLQEYLKLLNGLHDQGFYKRIYIDIGELDMDL